MPGAFIDPQYSFLISIGDNCSLSNGVIILAHDASTYKFTNGYTRIGIVKIKDNCYIGTNAIILPGVTIGPNVLIAAGSLVNKSIPPNSCVAGVPARVYSKFDEFIKHHEEVIKLRPSFDYKDFNSPNNDFKEKIKKMLDEDQIYVKGFDGKFPWTNT
jgi:maltose O-acetyltransferase